LAWSSSSPIQKIAFASNAEEHAEKSRSDDIMQNLDLFNHDFGADGSVRFMLGKGNMPIAEICNDLGSASIALQGAHILNYRAKGGEPLIWMSEDATFAPGKSLRGGVPICWPWFGPHASDSTLPGHGPVRTTDWKPVAASNHGDGSTQIRFEWVANAKTEAMCAHALRVQLLVTVGSQLSLALETTNLGTTPFALGEAFHTYFEVGDVRKATVEGLDGCQYIDKVDGCLRKTQHGAVSISAETDRIYLGTGNRCAIVDPVLGRTITIHSQGSDSVVIWNPWIETASKMGDLGQDGYRNMLCVETTNAADDMVQLAAGATHRLVTCYGSEELART